MRRKTSRVRKRKNPRQIQLQVRSSRIVGFEILRGCKKLSKLAALLLVVGALVWGAREGLDRLFIQNPEFRLQEIELQTNGTMTVQDFAELTGVNPEESIFAADLREMTGTLQERPGILSVKMNRRLPGTLKVTVRERLPVAWVECRRLGIVGRNPETGLLVDEEGVCIPCETWWEESTRDLPVVMVREAEQTDLAVGKELRHREAVRGLSLLRASRQYLDGSQWSLPVVGVKNDYSLIAALNTGTEVTFGMYDHERQLQDLLAVLKHVEEDLAEGKREIATLNLIPERNVPVTFAANPPEAPEAAERTQDRLERRIREIVNRG